MLLLLKEVCVSITSMTFKMRSNKEKGMRFFEIFALNLHVKEMEIFFSCLPARATKILFVSAKKERKKRQGKHQLLVLSSCPQPKDTKLDLKILKFAFNRLIHWFHKIARISLKIKNGTAVNGFAQHDMRLLLTETTDVHANTDFIKFPEWIWWISWILSNFRMYFNAKVV